tara:strand:- start:812 stop:1459 length:648 start_codon:yes stop_codon:yes gene_type:complete
MLGTSNKTVLGAVQAQGDQQFKNVNNLLSLQDNHVEEFFQYHGDKFLKSLEQLMEDVTERVVSRMLSKLQLVQDDTTKTIKVHPDALREYEGITSANIELDVMNLLNSAIDSEVINQRKMAKSQFLESQGFSGGQQQVGVGLAVAGLTGQTQQYNQVQSAVGNGSGFPIPPSGQDMYGRPYWLDANGQASYEAPKSGLGLGSKIQKTAAWAKWLM